MGPNSETWSDGFSSKCELRFQWDRHDQLGGTDELGLGQTSSWFDRLHKLGETDFSNRLVESWSGKLGGTNLLVSVGLRRYERETESLHCRLSGTNRSSRLDRNVMKGNREFATPSR